jgi:2-haloacid dehalogenase
MAAPRPDVLLFDVNETLSDMAPMAQRFADIGAPGHLAKLWFAGLLRDGFALTAAGESGAFADIGRSSLAGVLAGQQLDRSVDEASEHVMSGFGQLALHPDVAPGVEALAGLGLRLVTLSNGAPAVAERLLTTAGIRDRFEAVLSVEGNAAWKPARAAYHYALEQVGVSPERAMLVAVHPWDTHGARRAGLQSAWIDRAGGHYPSYFDEPTLTAESLPRLADALGALG